MTEIKAHRTPRWQIALSWIIVLIPFVWGIVNTLRSSLALMRALATPHPVVEIENVKLDLVVDSILGSAGHMQHP